MLYNLLGFFQLIYSDGDICVLAQVYAIYKQIRKGKMAKN
jgi:hypothetical protein